MREGFGLPVKARPDELNERASERMCVHVRVRVGMGVCVCVSVCVSVCKCKRVPKRERTRRRKGILKNSFVKAGKKRHVFAYEGR